MLCSACCLLPEVMLMRYSLPLGSTRISICICCCKSKKGLTIHICIMLHDSDLVSRCKGLEVQQHYPIKSQVFVFLLCCIRELIQDLQEMIDILQHHHQAYWANPSVFRISRCNEDFFCRKTTPCCRSCWMGTCPREALSISWWIDCKY